MSSKTQVSTTHLPLRSPPCYLAEEGAAAQKEEEAEIDAGAQSAFTHEPTPSPDDVHGVTISPPSASDSSLGSDLWCSGPFARSTFGKSMGGQGADEARDGLLATRSGKMRALGTLDLMQVTIRVSVAGVFG